VSEEFSPLFGHSGIGVVEELSEGCFFACSLDGTIVIKGEGEEVDFAFGLRDAGLGGFGEMAAIFTRHRNEKGERIKYNLTYFTYVSQSRN